MRNNSRRWKIALPDKVVTVSMPDRTRPAFISALPLCHPSDSFAPAAHWMDGKIEWAAGAADPLPFLSAL
jgi:hypothetical protein